MVTFSKVIRDKTYSILLYDNLVKVIAIDGFNRETIVKINGDYNTITPNNLEHRLETILTFL